MTNQRTPEDIFLELTERCAELEWLIAMNEDNNGAVKGIIVGTGEFISQILEDLPDGGEYSIYQHGPETETEVH